MTTTRKWNCKRNVKKFWGLYCAVYNIAYTRTVLAMWVEPEQKAHPNCLYWTPDAWPNNTRRYSAAVCCYYCWLRQAPMNVVVYVCACACKCLWANCNEANGVRVWVEIEPKCCVAINCHYNWKIATRQQVILLHRFCWSCYWKWALCARHGVTGGCRCQFKFQHKAMGSAKMVEHWWFLWLHLHDSLPIGAKSTIYTEPIPLPWLLTIELSVPKYLASSGRLSDRHKIPFQNSHFLRNKQNPCHPESMPYRNRWTLYTNK